jgi:hypothetical protein
MRTIQNLDRRAGIDVSSKADASRVFAVSRDEFTREPEGRAWARARLPGGVARLV